MITQIVRDFLLIPNGISDPNNHFNTDLISGLIILAVVSLVIFGGIKRIGKGSVQNGAAMVVIYVVSVVYILLLVHMDVLEISNIDCNRRFYCKFSNGWGCGRLL